MILPTRGGLLVLCLFAPFAVSGAAAQAPQALVRPDHPCGVTADTLIGQPGIHPAPGWRADPSTDAARIPSCSAPADEGVEDDGEWYGRRLTLHRYAAWAAVGAFPVEIYTGWRLRSAGTDPEWVRDTHRATVWVLGGTFAVNTVTGAWNWWDSRKEPGGRGWRTAVVWINEDVVPHTATASDGSWDSGSIESRASGRVVIRQAGDQSYLCAFHPTMRADLTAR